MLNLSAESRFHCVFDSGGRVAPNLHCCGAERVCRIRGECILNSKFRAAVLALFLMRIGATAFAIEPTHQDVEYARVGDRSLALDLYQPTRSLDSEDQSPIVVWVHGGAWRSGSKKSVPVTSWLEHGFAIASVDYRLSPEAKFPAQIHDIKAAIRFLRDNASMYALDSDRIVVAVSDLGYTPISLDDLRAST